MISMSRRTTVRIGMLGAGKMALWHLRAYRRIPGAEVMAICNPKSARGLDFARRFGIKNHFQDPCELFKAPDLDAVDICTPTGSHAALIRQALDRGLNVYVEKPMCGTLDEADQIVSLNREKKKIVFVGFNYRFCREFLRIRDILRSGELGDVRFFLIVRGTVVSGDYHIFDPRSFSGTINEFTSTSVDLLRWWGFKDIEDVYAGGANVLPQTPAPDTVGVTLRLRGGIAAVLVNSYAMPSLATEVVILGSRKMLRLRYGKVMVQTLPDSWSIPLLLWRTFRESLVIPYRILYNPCRGSCRYFVECVRRGQSPVPDEIEGRENMRVCSLILESCTSGKGVPIPVVREGDPPQ